MREQITLLGPHEFSNSSTRTFDDWVATPPVLFSTALRISIFVSSAILAISLAAVFVTNSSVLWALPLIALHAVLGLRLRDRVNPILRAVCDLSVETQLLRDGIELLEHQQFESPKLRELSKQACGGSAALNKLERIVNALAERNKEWFYYPSLFLMLGTQLAMSLEHWRASNRASLMKWMEAFAEFEALNALAGYAYEHPEDTMPSFADDTQLVACALAHPLLPREIAVANDIKLDRDSPFYIVSGSNMSGKSTLLRAIGLNVVLARAGAPVRARSLQLAPLRICASISVVDSLSTGKSKFTAEIDRLRQAVDLSRTEPVLFLIDEILSGTNSRDRRIAAEAVLRTLIARGAIGALSTHDLALAEIPGGANVHMSSRGGANPLDFDYLLKPGVTTESSAPAIVRMAGIESD